LEPKGCRIDENIVRSLASHGIEIDRRLCAHVDKPGLHLIYQRYRSANEIYNKVGKMKNDKTWNGAVPSQTEIINLFVAKTTWYKEYSNRIPAAERHEEMRGWLAEESGCADDEELWGERKDKYTITDLEKWLDLKDGLKKKVVKNANAKDIVKRNIIKRKQKNTEKGKEKEMEEDEDDTQDEQIIGKGKGKGKGKEKGKEKEGTKEVRKRLHRKK
jgi:hypothetical protein